MVSDGCPTVADFHRSLGMIGNVARLAARTPMCTIACFRGASLEWSQWAYPYPSRSTIWKNSMQVLHTAEEPPNQGRIILAIIGCTSKRRKAEREMVSA